MTFMIILVCCRGLSDSFKLESPPITRLASGVEVRVAQQRMLVKSLCVHGIPVCEAMADFAQARCRRAAHLSAIAFRTLAGHSK